MKFLFDENLSRRLVRLLQDDFPGSEHVLASGLGSPLDEELFRLAAARGFVLVTQDKDFRNSARCAVRHPRWCGCGSATPRRTLSRHSCAPARPC